MTQRKSICAEVPFHAWFKMSAAIFSPSISGTRKCRLLAYIANENHHVNGSQRWENSGNAHKRLTADAQEATEEMLICLLLADSTHQTPFLLSLPQPWCHLLGPFCLEGGAPSRSACFLDRPNFPSFSVEKCKEGVLQVTEA